jgi:hypothetical protein
LRAEHFRGGHSAGHSAILEATSRIFAFVFQKKIWETREFRGFSSWIEAGVAFHFRSYELICDIKHQFSISPDSGGFNSALGTPAALPSFQKFSPVDCGKIVLHIQNSSAIADVANRHQIVFSAAMYA